jgi:FkbM family methyltransferase
VGKLTDLARYPRSWWRCWRRPEVVAVRGVRLELGPHVTPELRTVIYRERYERREAICLERILEPADTFVEIGAGIGFLSTLAALRIGSERVTAYEANPRMLEAIRRTWRLNGVEPELVHGVLGDGDGRATFHVEAAFVSSSLHRRSAAAEAVEVPRLDAVREMTRVRPTVVAMDVEGAERELVLIVPWDGVDRVVIDLHPDVIGRDGVTDVVGVLRDAGFREHPRLSSTNKKLLIRH